jgi:PPM family protein phosphatase
MGGHAAGERASARVVEHLARAAEERPRPEELVAAITRAGDAVALEASLDAACAGMGTTLVGLYLTELAGSPHWLVFNVGDSRLYLLAHGDLIQVTVDHSEVQELLDAGEIDEDEVADHPLRNVITRSLGSRPAPPVDTWMLPVEAGATYLLCSDGLTGELTDAQLQRLMTSSSTPQMAADRLVEAAERAGGHDNVTALVVRVSGAAAAPEPEVVDPSEDTVDPSLELEDTMPR